MTDTITLPRATVQQALEALTWLEPEGAVVTAARSAAIDALRAELKQPEQGGKTGWPPGLLQDDCRGLSKWLASQPDARRRVREAVAALEQQKPPPEAQTEAEKIAYCAGWWAAMEQKREQPDLLKRFAESVARRALDSSYPEMVAIVAAQEREACAALCDARYMGDNNREDMEARRCAAAIRARGNT